MMLAFWSGAQANFHHVEVGTDRGPTVCVGAGSRRVLTTCIVLGCFENACRGILWRVRGVCSSLVWSLSCRVVAGRRRNDRSCLPFSCNSMLSQAPAAVSAAIRYVGHDTGLASPVCLEEADGSAHAPHLHFLSFQPGALRVLGMLLTPNLGDTAHFSVGETCLNPSSSTPLRGPLDATC